MLRLRLLLLIALLLLMALMATRPVVQAAWQRNLAGNALLHGLTVAGADCTALPAAQLLPRLERAVALQPDSAAAWLALLRVRGMTDRARLAASMDELPAAATLEPVLAELAPPRMHPAWSWGETRCNETWAAWTTALIRAGQERWDDAVAYYQVGLGLTPGRAPIGIVREYYHALAHAGNVTPQAAAKYQTLADSSQQPPALSTAAAAPQWTLTRGAPIERSGYRLLGFDLDPQVLDAGAEALARLYWQDADGAVVQQSLQAANLWPNSGNAWRAAGSFWSCLPGYTEPGWLTACASQSSSVAGAANPVGLIRHDAQQSADSYIVTASVPVQAGDDLVVGGRWLNAGDFPAAHIAAQTQDERYAVLLDLSGLPRGQWQAVAGSAGQVTTDDEMVWWLRPRSGAGGGDFYFDDVFLFAIPADLTVSVADG